MQIKYRLLRLNNTRLNDQFTVTLSDSTGVSYTGMFRNDTEFDTQEEALAHAQNSDNWKDVTFVIIPTYYISSYQS